MSTYKVKLRVNVETFFGLASEHHDRVTTIEAESLSGAIEKANAEARRATWIYEDDGGSVEVVDVTEIER